MSDHEFCYRRVAARNHVGYLNSIPLSDAKEQVPIASISCVELILVQINACKSKSGLEVSLVVCCIVDKVERVACIIAQGSRLDTWKAEHRVKAGASLA